jgi:hypothetical protein
MSMESTTETTKVKIAEHEYIGADGSIVDDEESAQGYRYTLLANGENFVWNSADATADELRLLALFGTKTLATNEISQVRNNPKNKAIRDTKDLADEAIAAVKARFDLIRSGQWVDRTREGVGGARVNRDALAEAVCKVLIDNQKKTQDEVDQGYKATVRQRLDDDAEWLAKMRKFPPVAAAYALIVGKELKSTVTVDSMMD